MKAKYFIGAIAILLIATIFTGCGNGDKPKGKTDTKPISIKKYDTPPGADPSVPAEQGGEGFKGGEGWTTSDNYNYLGDPKAVKGGTITWSIPNFPPSLRAYGKDENSYYTRMMQRLVYESMLDSDPVNEDYTPRLATHWYISPDKRTYKFRINPHARWADGKPVVAEDVIATWKLMTDPTNLAGTSEIWLESLENPVVESKYIVSIKSKKDGWIYFNMAAGFKILPAHIIGNLSGKEYLEKYNYDVVPGSGPYYVQKEDVDKGRTITLRRRNDYWGEKERFAIGLNNFDVIKTDVVQDETLMFEKFKKGETDVYAFNRAQWWIEKSDFDEVQRGVVQKRKIFNQNPAGLSGLALNMRKPPFDDIRIRQAIQMLYDRKKFNEKLFFNEYKPTNSAFPATPYANQNNPVTEFSLDGAIKLLEEAGYTQKNSDGYRMKDGRVLELELPFTQASQERFLTIFQEDLKKAGIKLNLKQVDGTTNFKIGNERNFTMIMAAWAGQNPPSLDFNIISRTADDPNSTNWSGFKSKDVDKLAEKYNLEYDKKVRVKYVREIDSIFVAAQPYVFGWFADYIRLEWHNKFGMPKWIVCRFDDYYSSVEVPIFQMWWLDPQKYDEYQAALTNKSKKMEVGETINKFWLDVAERENKGENVVLNK